MIGTCNECAHKNQRFPCRECETIVEGDTVRGTQFKPICPLPRIGSKEWGWQCWCSSSNGEARFCPKNGVKIGYEVRRGQSEAWPYLVWGEAIRATVAIFHTQEDAYRFAELLARRDWRRENGDKR